MGWLKWLALLVIVLIVVLVWYWGTRPPVLQTTLQMEAVGGFAYVQPPGEGQVNVAFLRDTDVTEVDTATGNRVSVCKVDQLGVDLKVISGDIIQIQPSSVPVPANKMFDLAGAVVTFRDLDASPTPLTVNRGNRPNAAPFGPSNPNNDTEWANVKWVPGTSYGAPNTDYPTASLDPNWRGLVDGRIVLTRGEIAALHPSDVAVKDSVFEFRTKSGSANPFKQAITDTTMFTAEIPSDQIVINLTGAASGITQIIVKPARAKQPVKLKLIGRHAHQTLPVLPINAGIDHYCAFYELLQPKPVAKDRLIPYLSSGPTIASAAFVGQPSPGPYCPGDWFPE